MSRLFSGDSTLSADCHYRRRQRRRKVILERLQRVTELSLDYIPYRQFEAWLHDKKAEKSVIGPPPEGQPSGRISAPSGLTPYMASLYETPLLTRDQETHLFRKMNYLKYKAAELRDRLTPARPRVKLLDRIEKLAQEIVAVRNQIICANLRLVVSIAKRRLGSAEDFFDLVSDGNISLMRAVERFDFSLGNRFSTYATWAIVNNYARSIPESHRERDRFRTGQVELFTVTADVRGDEREEEARHARRATTLDGILQRLDPREREIIVCRYGLRHGDEPQTLKQVGDTMGVSKERIRQIEARALGKMRQVAVPGPVGVQPAEPRP